MSGLTNRARIDLVARELRLATHVTERCAWCPDWKFEGTLAEAQAASLGHRQQHHPEVKTSRRHKPRPGSWPISNKPVGENIAGVRAQGGATWDGASSADVIHGSPASSYRMGCRCPVCREDQRVRCAAMTERRYESAPPGAAHGSDSTYRNWGCRCPECREAHRTGMKKYRGTA